MSLEWIILSAEEAEELRKKDLECAMAEDERDARVKACEADGGHNWILYLDHPDDGSYAQLTCACTADMDYVYPDGHDMLYMYVDDFLVVDAGLSTLSYAARIPVTVSVSTSHISTPNGEEWNVEITMEPNGVIERIEEEGP